MDNTADIAIVGAGIVGLAHAYMALKKGHRVVMFERDQFAVGASVRNFGLSWPIGQEPSVGLDYALRARQHWQEVAREAGFWMKPNGSLHVVYHDDEWDVLQEFMERYAASPFQCALLTPAQVKEKSAVVKQQGLRGALWSATEGTVNPREAIRRIPLWLQEKYGLILKFGHVVTEIALPRVKTARETWNVSKVFVCSGADFETLYPEVFDQHPVSKCKLHMMKAVTAKPVDLGPTLCAGLTLRHYAAFGKCPSLSKVDARYDRESEAYKNHGVHVLLAQNAAGELIIGDSHHYSRTVEPFDSEEVNDIILNYLRSFAELGDLRITERWHGVYPKVQGNINLTVHPEPGVTIVTGMGGAGMTLSFGLAEKNIEAL
ncbi:TIGR03364 family FAD-dependent oxidoreductase [Chryseolinea lacunae]|uniref:TIGR03364 family FAD-dependent oxidoreductase n=1 Tax=Chryseolinea lacunae TaxID=2801331 RepID=A0ABS1KZ56_9BACT|nr:TIGR03364 family FAD-dependent oxidoreductase [Chryseolinea lacunae]MBL0744522.1 TIGR03364 family FAD-dependent oxidoreductase [Chryseolinea lacunae]